MPPAPTFTSATVDGTKIVLVFGASAATPATESFVVEAGSGPGLTDLAAVATVQTTLSVDNVPPGTYFIRIRGVNAAGMSTPSNERTVTVSGCPGRVPGNGLQARGRLGVRAE